MEEVTDETFWKNFCTTQPRARKLVTPLITINGKNGNGRELCFHVGSLSLFIYLDLSVNATSVPATVSFYESSKLIATKSSDWLKIECHIDLMDLWYQYFIDY